MIFLLNALATELKLRGFSNNTVQAYLHYNQDFLNFCKKDPNEVSEMDAKEYLAHLISEKRLKPASLSLALSALKFYYSEVLKKKVLSGIKPPKPEKKLPVVLTKGEIKRMLAATPNPKHRLLIKFIYGSGLRVSESIALMVNDLDFNENMGIVRSGKGKKDRNIIIPRQLAEELRSYLNQRKGNSPYLFGIRDRHLSKRQAQKIVSNAAKRAEIKKRVFCHALRSSFATHLLESGTDIRIIQELLGHSNLSTTQKYTKVSNEQLKKVKSPLDTI